jgi:hypothetical protein
MIVIVILARKFRDCRIPMEDANAIFHLLLSRSINEDLKSLLTKVERVEEQSWVLL